MLIFPQCLAMLLGMKKLTALQRATAEEFMLDRNAKQAYLRAGGKSKRPEQSAHEIMTNPDVMEYVKELTEERSKVVKYDAAWVLRRLGDMITADPAEILTDQLTFKPLHEWPIIWRQMLSAVDIQEIFAGKDKDKAHIGNVIKAKFIDKLKALQMLGDHVDIAAFAKNLNVSVKDELSDRMAAARKRAQDGNTTSLH